MPIYEYECPRCGRVFEEWVKASEAHREEPCPDCGTPSPRVISRTSFVLKGDGWYVSDYGYRKGITEDGGGKAAAPAKNAPGALAKKESPAPAKKESAPPATQADKSLSKTADAPKKAPDKKSAPAKPATRES